jgi:hypothetical protein
MKQDWHKLQNINREVQNINPVGVTSSKMEWLCREREREREALGFNTWNLEVVVVVKLCTKTKGQHSSPSPEKVE